MATFFLDYEGGNDANAGTSFALRWKTITSGATAARIAPGDTIKIMGSPAPTSLGQNGTWTDGPLQTTKAIVSSTNATPIVVTLSGANWTLLAPVVGDTVIINGHTTNTKANGVWKISATNGSTTVTLVNADGTNSVGNGVGGASGTIRKITNCVVTLATAVTKPIACLGNQGTKTNWTASANVTDTVITSDFKEGGECQQIAVAAAFTTGLAAYFALPLLTDFSAYKQVTFWIKQTAGTVAVAGDVSLRLCTDTVGAVSVNTIAVPALPALNRWMPVTVDTGAALSALAQSVALYVDTDRGAQTFLIDAVQAVKDSTSADSLSQTSLIGKNTGTETWWGIQSINGVRVMLDRDVNCIPSNAPQRGYAGTTATTTAYKRETIKLVSTAGTDMVTQEAGTAAALTAYEGGWDRTAMTTQNLESWFDRQGGNVAGVRINTAFNTLNKINMVRCGSTAFSTTDYTVLGTLAFNNGSSALQMTGAQGGVFTDLVTVSNATNPLGLVANGIVVNSITSLSNAVGNVGITSASARIGSITASNTDGNGVDFVNGTNPNRAIIGSVVSTNNDSKGISASVSEASIIRGGSTSGNGTGGISFGNGNLFLRNFTIGEATEVSGPTGGSDAAVFSENHDGTTGNHQIFGDGGLISSEATVRHTASGISWAMKPTSAVRTVTYPLTLSVAKVAVNASSLVTVTLWTRRTNTGLTQRLVCKGGQIGGVASDVIATSTEAANTWGGDGAGGPLSITFTPTEAGVVEITAEAYGGTTFTGYVDDLTVTQV